MRHAFWPRCHVEGSIITKEGEINCRGQGIFIHALQGMKPHHAAARWNYATFQSPTYSAVMMEYTTPISYGSTVVNVGGVAKNGEIICGGAANSVQHAQIKNDPDNAWPEPGAARFLWSGRTQDGKNVDAEVEGSLGDRLDKIDVLANIPGILKSLVGGVVGTKPFIYQVSRPDSDQSTCEDIQIDCFGFSTPRCKSLSSESKSEMRNMLKRALSFQKQFSSLDPDLLIIVFSISC